MKNKSQTNMSSTHDMMSDVPIPFSKLALLGDNDNEEIRLERPRDPDLENLRRDRKNGAILQEEGEKKTPLIRGAE